MRRRQAVGNFAEAAADGLHRQMKQQRRDRCDHDRDQHARPGRAPAAQREDQRRGTDADAERSPVQRRQRLAKGEQLGRQWARLGTVQRQAEQVPELACEDGGGDAAGEADGHGMRHVADQRTEPGRADHRQHRAGDQHGQQQPVDPELGDGSRHQHDEGTGGAADLETAAAERRDQEAADDGGE